MKTRIYIDGYNLYYGCLKNTSYKWLDLYTLFHTYIMPRSGSPTSDIDIKYFTAVIHESAANDSESVIDQVSYHRALNFHRPSEIEIIKGYYSINKVDHHKVEDGKHLRLSEKVKVWKIEEKKSDVHLSVSAIYDAILEEDLEQIVFVTNDTDMVPALEKIKSFNQCLVREKKRPPIKIGLVIPTKNNSQYRRPNQDLHDLSDWTVSHIEENELEGSQLPWKVLSGRKPAIRPISWFRHAVKVKYIYTKLLEVEKKPSKCWRWLDSVKPSPPGMPTLSQHPIYLLDDDNGINDVIKHVDAYVAHKKSS